MHPIVRPFLPTETDGDKARHESYTGFETVQSLSGARAGSGRFRTVSSKTRNHLEIFLKHQGEEKRLLRNGFGDVKIIPVPPLKPRIGDVEAADR